jgi:hypothetical protein
MTGSGGIDDLGTEEKIKFCAAEIARHWLSCSTSESRSARRCEAHPQRRDHPHGTCVRRRDADERRPVPLSAAGTAPVSRLASAHPRRPSCGGTGQQSSQRSPGTHEEILERGNEDSVRTDEVVIRSAAKVIHGQRRRSIGQSGLSLRKPPSTAVTMSVKSSARAVGAVAADISAAAPTAPTAAPRPTSTARDLL